MTTTNKIYASKRFIFKENYHLNEGVQKPF